VNAILECWSQGKIKNAEPKIIISSSRENASMLEIVSQKYGVKTEILEYSGKRIKDEYLPDNSLSEEATKEWKSNSDIQQKLTERWESYDKKLFALLCDNEVTPQNGLVCLAEYRLIISNELARLYEDRIMNIHPSLLPSFPGWRDVLENTLKYGVKITGVSVHLVNEVLDSGSIIAQIPVPIFDGDDASSLRQRLLEEACKLYPYCVNLFTAGQIQRKNGLLQGCNWKEAAQRNTTLWSYTDLLV